MKLFTRGSLLGLLIVVAAMAVAVAPAAAGDVTVRITGGAVSGSLTAVSSPKAVFTAGATHIECTSHTVTATTNGTASVSMTTNKYTGCSVRETGNSVSVTVSTAAACAWTLTASTLTSGNVTVPKNCVSFSVTVFGGNACTVTVQQTTVAVTWTNTTKSLAVDNPNTVPFLSSGFPCPAAGNATQAETLSLPGASVTSGAP